MNWTFRLPSFYIGKCGFRFVSVLARLVMTTDSMQEPKAVSKQWKKLPSSFDKHEIPVHEWVSGSPIASIMFIHGLGLWRSLIFVIKCGGNMALYSKYSVLVVVPRSPFPFLICHSWIEVILNVIPFNYPYRRACHALRWLLQPACWLRFLRSDGFSEDQLIVFKILLNTGHLEGVKHISIYDMCFPMGRGGRASDRKIYTQYIHNIYTHRAWWYYILYLRF